MSVVQAIQMSGAAVSAAGSLHEAQTQASMEEAQATQAQYNAAEVRAKAIEDERKSRVMSSKVLGDMRAGYGASGITMDGSPLDVLEDSAKTAELDALSIRHRGELESWAYNAEAAQHRFSAEHVRMGGYISAASKLLQGAGAAASYSPGSPTPTPKPTRTG